MTCDPYDVLRTVLRWTTVFRGLFWATEIFIVIRVGMAIRKCCNRHRWLKWVTAMAVWGIMGWCTAEFVRNLQEDYAYVVLGGEDFSNVPHAMRWLVENGGKSRLIRTVRASVNVDDIEMRNTRLYAALILAKKDPEGSRNVFSTVVPFAEPCTRDQTIVFGTNRYSFPVSGTDVLQMKWNDGTTNIVETVFK